MMKEEDIIWSSGAGTRTWFPARDWICCTITWLAMVPALKEATAMMAMAIVVFHLVRRIASLDSWIIPSPKFWVLVSSRPSSALCPKAGRLDRPEKPGGTLEG